MDITQKSPRETESQRPWTRGRGLQHEGWIIGRKIIDVFMRVAVGVGGREGTMESKCANRNHGGGIRQQDGHHSRSRGALRILNRINPRKSTPECLVVRMQIAKSSQSTAQPPVRRTEPPRQGWRFPTGSPSAALEAR